MRAAWQLDGGSVEEIRQALPRGRRSAYTTIQTVLNRLAERGLLNRERAGNAYVYVPDISEAEYVSKSLSEELEKASPQAREAALASLVGGLEGKELEALRAQAAEIANRRKGRGK